MNRDEYWRAWFADQDRKAAEITQAFEDIMAIGYDVLGENPPERTAPRREFRDRDETQSQFPESSTGRDL